MGKSKRCHHSKSSNKTNFAIIGNKDSNAVLEALNTLDKLYAGHSLDARYLRGDPDRAYYEVQEVLGSGEPATYGEISPQSFVSILCQFNVSPGQRFYDLGSGTGKTVVLAWL